MTYSLFRNGYTNLHSTEKLDDFDELCDTLSQVTVGPKNGDYLVRGECTGERSDANMASMNAIIIDGDQTLDLGKTCVPLEPVHELLKAKDVRHIIHSSYSQDLANNIFKWRCYIPCNDLVDAGTLKEGAGEVVSMLHDNGIMVRNVKENSVPSQPWFLPRCQDGMEMDFSCHWHDGKPWTLGNVGIAPSAGLYNANVNDNGNGSGGAFSWDWAIGQFQAGTVHQGVKSICGWLIHTTDWVDSQIKAYLITQITALCPDEVKVKRVVETKEIDNLIKYCREKHGVFENSADWKSNLITAEALKGKEFDEIVWAVDHIVPEGLTVLAGDPKVGKSLVAVDICSAIASGEHAFGNRKCTEGTCLYVSMEDPERRIKARIRQQCDLWPESFKIQTGGMAQLGVEFYKQLDEMKMMWPDLRCIVIDTMAFIMPQKPVGVSDYDHIYKHLDPLHRWCLLNHVSIILITHTTKARIQDGENPFSGIIGSVAIQGCSDSMIMLRRNHAKEGLVAKDPDIPDGFLHVQGRELGTDVYALEFDSEALKWAITREAEITDVTKNPNYLLIADSLKNEIKGPKAISSDTQINRATVRSCLKRMVDKDTLIKTPEGLYGLKIANYDNIES